MVCLTTCPGRVIDCQSSNARWQIPDDVFSLNTTIEIIEDALGSDAVIYAYVMTSVTKENGSLKHQGCGPNIEGGLITLCTCKHYMRSAKHWLDDSSKNASNKWVAGFTDNKNGGNVLFYLMKIGEVYESHADLWRAFLQQGRQKILDVKNSSSNPLGDVYQPKDIEKCFLGIQYKQESYENTIAGHEHDGDWRKDINYEGYGKQQAAMLVGEAVNSFVWTKEMVFSKLPLPRSTKKYGNPEDFLNSLKTSQKGSLDFWQSALGENRCDSGLSRSHALR